MEHTPGLKYDQMWCRGCKKYGYVFFHDYFEDQLYIRCEVCGWVTSQVGCERCLTGGNLVANLDQKPAEWVCKTCKEIYSLPETFYTKPARIYFLEDLSDTLKQEVLDGDRRARIFENVAFTILTIVFDVYSYFLLNGVGLNGKSGIPPYLITTAVIIIVLRFYTWLWSPHVAARFAFLGMLFLVSVPPLFRLLAPHAPTTVIDIASLLALSVLVNVTLRIPRS